MSHKWYTADFHLYHDNILKYCARPFENVFQMHETIVENNNRVVAPNDELFIIGDLSFYAGNKIIELLARMHGRKTLLIGNHDAKAIKKLVDVPEAGVEEVTLMKIINDNKRVVTLCHYYAGAWKAKGRGRGWMLHGHSHGTLKHIPRVRRFDVGVDAFDFTPIKLDYLESILDLTQDYKEPYYIRNKIPIFELPEELFPHRRT